MNENVLLLLKTAAACRKALVDDINYPICNQLVEDVWKTLEASLADNGNSVVALVNVLAQVLESSPDKRVSLLVVQMLLAETVKLNEDADLQEAAAQAVKH